jgi:cellulose synthase/poly-beta-1,6-N-acetylglucosamine synthase-like glycosyltransferase/peptidoglycan/xylan/chitin deacetylase (PgdA/CDA1 family)
MTQPIFYDASGRRRRVAMVATLLLALALAGLAWWTATVLGARDPHAALRFVEDAGAPQGLAVADSAGGTAAWLPKATPATGKAPLRLGFYMPWDAASRASLAAHGGELDWLAAGLASVTGPDHRIAYDHDDDLARSLAAQASAPRLLPMIQNADGDGRWDGEGTARLLASAPARARFADRIVAIVAAEKGAGVMLDLESLPATAHQDYRRFLGELRARFAPRGWSVMLAVPVGDPAWDLAAYAAVADRLVLMAYDEHWMGGEAGPIASQGWFAQTVAAAVAHTGADKAIVAIGNYAYDWQGRQTTPLTVAAAWQLAARAGVTPRFDQASGNPHFAYVRDGATHQVWLLDATTAWNQRRAIERTGAAGIALWRLGSEDPRLWDALAAGATSPPDLSGLPAPAGVEVTGLGEIMRLDRQAAPGHRTLAHDRDGLIRDVRVDRLATGDLVQRTGARRRLVALTFDDGPDPLWTPQILDVLRRERAPATFFVTGTNALGQRTLLNRIVDEGSELGNHSTSHADLGREPGALVGLELNATARLVEAYTGRGMRLFRPPYLGDADPGTHDELHASRVAADLGYLTVGLNVDPLDWRAPGVDAIVANTVRQVTAGTAARPAQIVLLHDAGGDRSQTVAALPRIIRELRTRGYDFVTVSALAGLPRDAVMPRLDTGTAVRATRTRGLFAGLWGVREGLAILFVAVILLGMGRSLALTALAWRHRHRGDPPAAAPHLVPRFVSVLIPAFNEARVIEASVRRILQSRDVHLEVIVIDDGSTDDTSAVVRAAFGIDPRVTLLTLRNGGKAAALNAALRIARGDLIVALDADTQFEPDTIALMARWFADPGIGAVAGNAKIGNAVNWITRWQRIEYVTAQNLERRALAALGAVTVVPGAVGAWRRTALDAVGGYPEDTLAEDQDLTIAIQRAGWRVACDTAAVAWTEAPETARALFKQRFRWAYGTLQCLWKHRGAIGQGGLGRIGLPQAILFQFLLAAVSPLVDLALAGAVIATGWRLARDGWVATGGDTATVLAFWAAFTAVDLGCGWAAFRLDAREARFPAIRLLTMRFGYRQLLYAVVLRAIAAAVTGPKIGWGKLERSGRVTAPAGAPATVVPMPVRVPFRRAA